MALLIQRLPLSQRVKDKVILFLGASILPKDTVRAYLRDIEDPDQRKATKAALKDLDAIFAKRDMGKVLNDIDDDEWDALIAEDMDNG